LLLVLGGAAFPLAASLGRRDPLVEIGPTGGGVSNPTLIVTISWNSPTVALDESSRQITLNGTNVTGAFHHTPTSSTDTITLVSGSNTLGAFICDIDGFCGSDSEVYVLDNTNPAVRITPAEGYFRTSPVAVTIDWLDNVALNPSSAQITVDGASVQWGHSGVTDSLRSSGSASLENPLWDTHVVSAQICDQAGNCGQGTANYIYDPVSPTVSIDPGGATFENPSRPVTISWGDNRVLDVSTDTIRFNGTLVTDNFNFTQGGGGSATSTNTLTLQAGQNTLFAKICDLAGNCTSNSVTYTLTAADVQGPSGSVIPTSGEVQVDNLDITITWSDNVQVAQNGASQEITWNGVPVSFNYTVINALVATSRDTVPVQSGFNELKARVRDAAGNWSVQLVETYYRGTNTAPDVEINPGGGSFSSGALPVTISWTDNFKLNASSRVIRLNGTLFTDSFTWVPNQNLTTATSARTIQLQSGTNTLVARICDTSTPVMCGQDSVTYILTGGLNPSAPVVDVATVNPGSSFNRSLCLTINVGEAAVECGDLRLVHPLPATLHMSKQRQPVLTYNSQHSHPHPHVIANVSLPAGAEVPDTVEAVLKVGQALKATRKWPGSQWNPGTTRQIAIGYDAISEATGVKPYTLEVNSHYNGGVALSDTASGDLAIVNRSASYFGAGWWLAGLEQLDVGTMTWVGGDGSIKKYTSVASNVWAAANVDQPDTIKFESGSYVRFAKGGTKIFFNPTGQHIVTRTRLGVSHQTAFLYTSGRLSGIYFQSGTSPNAVYSFAYPTTPIPMIQVTAPPLGTEPRITKVWLSGGRVDLIIDPDDEHILPSYWGGRIDAITNRRGVTTYFDYDTNTYKVLASRLQMEDGQEIADTIQTIETQAVTQAIDTAAVRVLLNGPRADVSDTTAFFLDRFGAPRKIRNALGHVTTLKRGNATFPALVTQVIHPNNFVDSATHNARGNITTRLQIAPYGASGPATAVTRYEYKNSAWPDFPTSIVAPEGDSVAMGYDPGTGNRIWQQDRRGISSRVEFRYYGGGPWHGLIKAIDPPDLPGGITTQADSIVYGEGTAVGVNGNVAAIRTAMGFWSYFHKDGAGRDTLVITPIEGALSLRDSIKYDIMGREMQRVTRAPATSASCTGCTGAAQTAQTLTIVNEYDPNGNLLGVLRTVTPVSTGVDLMQTSYTYDYADRKSSETNYGSTQTFLYDPAGNLRTHVTAVGDSIRQTFDAANQLKNRIVPQRVYFGAPCEFGNDVGVPCIEGLDFDALTIPADTSKFKYDGAGRMSEAQNRSALVTRKYYPNGLLEHDSIYMASYDSPSFSHAYGTGHSYDRNGRRKDLSYPVQLSMPVISHGYATWGALETVSSGLGSGSSYTFGYDELGRIQSLQYPNETQLTESFAYDADGRRVRRQLNNGGATNLYDDTLVYDARGKIKHVHMRTINREAEYWYSGLGQVAASRWQNTVGNDFQIDEYRADAHGNTYWSRKQNAINSEPTYAHSYDSFGRLEKIEAQDIINKGGTNSFRTFDFAGNLSFATDIPHAPNTGERSAQVTRYYYSAEGKLVYLQRYGRALEEGVEPPHDDLREETRYDALGRRVLVRTQHTPFGAGGPSNVAAITRFIWDGDQLLAEFRAPGGPTDNLDAPTATGRQFGEVVYVHGPGIDAPLGIYRKGFSSSSGPTLIVPYTNWRGQYERGSFLNGDPECDPQNPQQPCIEVDWPAPKLRTNLDGQPRVLGDWVGSLIPDQLGQSGLLFRRNRYYDPQTGQFTQEDPIGLAGGLNLYGFADGDPVNFSDPFGLCPECRMGWGAPTPENIEKETRYYASLTNRDRVAIGVSVVAASAGGFAILQAGAAAAGVDAIMIGETMTRVGPAAAALGAKTFHVSKEAVARGARSMWAENKAWLEAAVERGALIYDKGRHAAREVPSRFYKAEKLLLEKLGVKTVPVR
jgi:RHS repeat-associated protein